MFGRLNILVIAVAIIGISAGCNTNAREASNSNNETTLAVEFVQHMINGRFTDAAAHFDNTMSDAISTDQLKQTWESLIEQFGTVKNVGETHTEQEGGFDIVFVPCHFEKTTLDIKLIFGKESKISGLWFVPHTAAVERKYSPPVYAQNDRFYEKEVTVGSGEWALPGTLSIPKGKGPFSVVVLVHGSGPNDRDETLGPNKPFRDIAWGLASKGIAVLRYDKRTKVYPANAAKLMNTLTVEEEVIDDALAAVELLRSTAKIDSNKIFVMGHSLGGMLIPRIGKADQRIAGLIVLAGSTRPLEDICLDQATYLASLNGTPSAEAKAQIDTLRRQVENVKSPELSSATPASSLPMGIPAAYWLDLRGYQPAETAKSLKQPMLIIQGGRDYQVTSADYEGWKRALSGRPNITFKLYPDLNHLLIDGKEKSTPQEYEKHGSVSKTVIDDLAVWINNQIPH